MIYAGLVSITFRKLAVREIVELAANATLTGIEWGGDVHVPHGDIAAAKQARSETEAAGLKVSAYGSYYRFDDTDLAFAPVLASAEALGAPLIRVWAGKLGSAQADAAYHDRIVKQSRQIATEAEAAGIAIAYEYHGGTLTDTPQSARALLEAVNHPNVFSYWQPLSSHPDDTQLSSLEDILPWLTNLHVYHWSDRTRCPLADGSKQWESYLEFAAKQPGDRYASLEFVRDDDPKQLLADAKTLHTLLAKLDV